MESLGFNDEKAETAVNAAQRSRNEHTSDEGGISAEPPRMAEAPARSPAEDGGRTIRFPPTEAGGKGILPQARRPAG